MIGKILMLPYIPSAAGERALHQELIETIRLIEQVHRIEGLPICPIWLTRGTRFGGYMPGADRTRTAMMNEEHPMEEVVARAFRAHPWRGVVPVEQAIAVALDYRRSLSPEECAAYDEAILAGWTPWQAAEAVEIMAGRQTPGNTGRSVQVDQVDTEAEPATIIGR